MSGYPNNAGGVTSVFTRTGAVVAAANDYSLSQLSGLIGLRQLVYRYTVSGSVKASIDTGVDTAQAGSNDWTNGDLLEVFLYARTDEAVTGSAVSITVNNDGTSIYDRQVLAADNATVTGAGNVAAAAWTGVVCGASALANYFGLLTIWIPDYAGTVGFKAARLDSGVMDSVAANQEIRTNFVGYRSTTAITRLKAIPTTAAKNFAIGSQLLIYKTLTS